MKSGRYLKYAFGEIILVVVGILIALAINNFNQTIKSKRIYNRMVSNLIIEFNANLNQIENVKDRQQQSLQATFHLIDLIKKEQIQNDSISIWIGQLGNDWTFDAQSGVLNNAISSGDIHLLKSDSLKNLLFGWEGLTLDLREEQDRAFDAIQRINVFLEKHIQIADATYYYRDKFPKSQFESDFNSLFASPQFEDLLVDRGISLLDQLKELESLNKQNLLIKKFLEGEL